MIHALALSVPIPAPHLPAALDVGPFVPGVAYTAPKDYYGMPQDAGYAGLINRAQQLEPRRVLKTCVGVPVGKLLKAQRVLVLLD